MSASTSKSPELSGRLQTWQRRATIALGVVVALNIAAFLIRAGFVMLAGPYASTTGFEEFCLYNIWKAAHGFPVYEWPQRDQYMMSFYNVGFYYTYAGWAKLWHASGPELVAATRLLSPIFAVFGMWIQVRLLRRLLPQRDRGTEAWIWRLSFLVWFGTAFNAWTTLSARPDVPAVACALAGFALALHAQESGRSWHWIASSLVFSAAWSFKQSAVWILVGTVLHLLIARAGWRALLALCGPFVVLAAACFALGSAEYRYNLTQVPRILAWLPAQSAPLFAQALVLNFFFFAFALKGWLQLARGWSAQPQSWRAMAVASVPPLVMGFAQLALRGSSTNNMLEGFVMVSLLGSACWLRAETSEANMNHLRWIALGACSLAAMAPLPAVQLANAARGITYVRVQNVSIGNVIKLNRDQLARRERFAEWLKTLPKPLWTRDAMFEMPWFATDDQYPAFVLNFQFEDDAKEKHVMVGEGFAEWILKRHFACLLLPESDSLAGAAQRAGYVSSTIPTEFASLPSEFGSDGPAPLLWSRPPIVPR